MRKRIDNLGRFVIPKELREYLEIQENDELDFDIIDDKIIITKTNRIMSKSEIEELYHNVQRNLKSNKESEYQKGFIDALKMILRK